MDNKQNSSVPTAFGLLGIEHKIGEIVKFGDKKYKSIEVDNSYCDECDLFGKNYCHRLRCSIMNRHDRKSIIYKEVKDGKRNWGDF